MPTRLTRRQFIVGGLSTIPAALLASSDILKETCGVEAPGSPLVRVFKDKETPLAVAQAFVSAPSTHLMAMYAVFFPMFMETYQERAPTEIIKAAEEVKNQYPRDHHRLDALPGVVAAHRLVTTNSDDEREYLCSLIEKGLRNSNREIREITLQNLITSGWPNFDALKYFNVSEAIFKAGDDLISSAAETDKLVSPLCLYVQHLAAYRGLMLTRSTQPPQLAVANKQLEKIKHLSVDMPHLWYAHRLAQLYEGVDFRSVRGVPPQRSEAIMGWQQLYEADTRLYELLQHLALIQYRNSFAVYLTAEGRDISHPEVMTEGQAQRAIHKGASVIQNFSLRRLMADVPELPSSRREKEFQQWLLEGWLDKYTVAHEFETTRQEEKALALSIPFSQFEPRTLPRVLLREADQEKRALIIDGLIAAVHFAMTLPAAYGIVNALFKWQFGPDKALQYAQEIKPHMHEIQELINEDARQKTEKLGEQLERQQNALGQPPAVQ